MPMNSTFFFPLLYAWWGRRLLEMDRAGHELDECTTHRVQKSMRNYTQPWRCHMLQKQSRLTPLKKQTTPMRRRLSVLVISDESSVLRVFSHGTAFFLPFKNDFDLPARSVADGMVVCKKTQKKISSLMLVSLRDINGLTSQEIAAAKSRGWPEWWVSPETAQLPPDEPTRCCLLQLPEELLHCILERVEDWVDRVCLCEADPRIGKRALETLSQYRDPMFGIAQYLKNRGRYAIDERLLRKYASLRGANAEGVAWLQKFGATIGSDDDDLPVRGTPCLVIKLGAQRFSIEGNRKKLRTGIGWFLTTLTTAGYACQIGLTLVRHVNANGLITLFEGLPGSEHLTSALFKNGSSQHYLGPRGYERLCRVNFLSGKVNHYQGKATEERLIAVDDVRRNCKEMAVTRHYVGARNAERLVSIDCHYDGSTEMYMGEPKREMFYRRRDKDGGVTSYTLTDHVDEQGRYYLAKRHYIAPDGSETIYDGPYNKTRRLAIKRKHGAIEYMTESTVQSNT